MEEERKRKAERIRGNFKGKAGGRREEETDIETEINFQRAIR
jgi:hypothetical protein